METKMFIQNTGRVFGSTLVPPHKVTKTEDTDFARRLVPSKVDGGFEAFAPHAPVKVKQAWQNATEKAGTSGLGVGQNGLMTHIPAALVVQVEQRQATGSSDIFGNSISSAKETAQKILSRLENPATPELNVRIRELHEQEKEFYRSFINNLEL